jgi:hypothetical protein
MTQQTRTAMIVMVAVLGTVASQTAGHGNAAAEDFRVDNRVFLDNQKQPCVESTTIFFSGEVYDYLKTPPEITVFDKSNGRFVLLDTARRVKTEVKLDKVAALSEHVKTWALHQTDPLLSFLASPKLDQRYQAETGTLVLSSPLVTYEVATTAAGCEAVSTQYREFSDWYCQLNTLLNPGSRPPFARMVVSEALDSRQLFPREVRLTLQLGSGLLPKRITIRSQHRLVGRLVESDRDRVAQTGQYLAIFPSVPFDEYQDKLSP